MHTRQRIFTTLALGVVIIGLAALSTWHTAPTQAQGEEPRARQRAAHPRLALRPARTHARADRTPLGRQCRAIRSGRRTPAPRDAGLRHLRGEPARTRPARRRRRLGPHPALPAPRLAHARAPDRARPPRWSSRRRARARPSPRGCLSSSDPSPDQPRRDTVTRPRIDGWRWSRRWRCGRATGRSSYCRQSVRALTRSPSRPCIVEVRVVRRSRPALKKLRIVFD